MRAAAADTMPGAFGSDSKEPDRGTRQMKPIFSVFVMIAVLCRVLPSTSTAVASPPDPAAVLSVVPADFWALLQINNQRALDDKLAHLFQQINLPPLRVMESFQAKINLGPQIKHDGSLTVVLMPAESVEELGSRAVLIFPCDSVESLLADFKPEKITEHLWRGELVWGPTFVGRKGDFAVFGATQEATTSVLESKAALGSKLAGLNLAEFSKNDINILVRSRELVSSTALQAVINKQNETADSAAIFGADSLLHLDSRALQQIEAVHVGIDLNAARLRLTAELRPVENSTLSKLLAFAAPAEHTPLSLLPDQPYIMAAAASGTPQQLETKADEFDKLFQSPAIESATNPEKLAQFRQSLKTLIRSISEAAAAVSTESQSPEGLAAVIAVLKVADARHWINELHKAADVLMDDLFISEASNRFFRDITFETGADTIDGVSVDHLVLELIEAPAPTDPKDEALDYAATFGTAKKVIQLASVDDSTVAVCLGDQPRVMGSLILAARGQAQPLTKNTAVTTARSFLPPQSNMIVLLSPQELIRTARTLARIQDKVEAFPYLTPVSNLPIAATITRADQACRIEVAIPIDLAAAIRNSVFPLGRATSAAASSNGD